MKEKYAPPLALEIQEAAPGAFDATHGSVFLDCGGPMHGISVGGKIYEFEMHPYCGPTLLNRKGEPLEKQPHDFLHAASQWAKQGQRMEGELCRWDHEPKEILKHLGGNDWLI